MTNCNNIKSLIDEAEQPDLLPFEATHHLNACAPCRQFADERASLRGLLNGMPRVHAPLNFDAQLKARITTAKAQSFFAWLSPTLYLRVGAVAAVLVVGVFVAQYNGMFSRTNNEVAKNNTSSAAIPPSAQSFTPDDGSVAQPPGKDVENPKAGTLTPPPIYVAASDKGNRRVQPLPVKLEDDSMLDRVPGLIVRNKDRRDVELPMLPVSLGAQQQLINRSSRSAVQPIAISF